MQLGGVGKRVPDAHMRVGWACRFHAALGDAAARRHHRAVPADPGAQVQPGEDDLPEVRFLDMGFDGLAACVQHCSRVPGLNPCSHAQVLRTPAPTGCELQKEEVWAYKPAAHQEEDQVGQRVFRDIWLNWSNMSKLSCGYGRSVMERSSLHRYALAGGDIV